MTTTLVRRTFYLLTETVTRIQIMSQDSGASESEVVRRLLGAALAKPGKSK